MKSKLELLDSKKKGIVTQQNDGGQESKVIDLKDVTEVNVRELTDEQLKIITSNLSLNDSEGRNLIFLSEEEAILYSAQIQRNIPQIRFVKIHKCFSIYAGKFYMIEPMTTQVSEKMTDEQLGTAGDFSTVSGITLLAIAELAKREREALTKATTEKQ